MYFTGSKKMLLNLKKLFYRIKYQIFTLSDLKNILSNLENIYIASKIILSKLKNIHFIELKNYFIEFSQFLLNLKVHFYQN